MTPIDFPESNCNLSKPDSITDEECSSLPVYIDGVQIVSCWQLSKDEILDLMNNGGKLYIGVLGQEMHPLWLSIDNPFVV